MSPCVIAIWSQRLNKATLGARLRRTIEVHRNARLEEALEAGARREGQPLEQADVGQVRRLFESARTRIKGMIEIDAPMDVCVLVGEEGAAVTEGGHNRAIEMLINACWPLTIAEGVRLQTNEFNTEWLNFCRWALREELVPELYAVHDEWLVRTRHYVRVRPFPA